MEFKVKAYLLLNDYEKADAAFSLYISSFGEGVPRPEVYNTAFQVSQLRDKIQTLEECVHTAESLKRYGIILGLVFIGLACVAVITFRKKSQINPDVDPATSLLNPDADISKIKHLDAPTENLAHALDIFDIKNFREANRLLGANKGDQILKEVTHTLISVTRNKDIIGRISPEQFILCLTNVEAPSTSCSGKCHYSSLVNIRAIKINIIEYAERLYKI